MKKIKIILIFILLAYVFHWLLDDGLPNNYDLLVVEEKIEEKLNEKQVFAKILIKEAESKKEIEANLEKILALFDAKYNKNKSLYLEFTDTAEEGILPTLGGIKYDFLEKKIVKNNIKEKDWSKRPTNEECKIASRVAVYMSNKIESDLQKDKREVDNRPFKELLPEILDVLDIDISEDEYQRIADKVFRWQFQD